MERARRLRKGKEFDTAFEEGAVLRGPLLVVRHRANGLERTRWGFAVGKRIARKAVERNRMRRRLREIARQIPVQPGHDIVVNARARALTASHRDLEQALRRLMDRAGLLGKADRA